MRAIAPPWRRVCLVGCFSLLIMCTGRAQKAKPDARQASVSQSESKDEIASKYRKAFDDWQQYIKQPKVQVSSRTSAYTDNEPYAAIVALGRPALPLIIADIERGQFFLNEAAGRISGVDVRKLYPDEKVVGEQDVSRLWVRWWNEKGRAEYDWQRRK